MKNRVTLATTLFSIILSLCITAGGEVSAPLGRQLGEKAWGMAAWMRGKSFEEQIQQESVDRMEEAFDKFLQNLESLQKNLRSLQMKPYPSRKELEVKNKLFADALIKCWSETNVFLTTNETNPENKCKANVGERGFAGLGTVGGLPVVRGICPTECQAKLSTILANLAQQKLRHSQKLRPTLELNRDTIFDAFVREFYMTHQCSPDVSRLLLQKITPPEMYHLLPRDIQPTTQQQQLIPICQELFDTVQ